MRLKPTEIVGAVAVIVFILVIGGVALVPALRQAPKGQCEGNLKNISIALNVYMTDTEGVFPPSSRWADAIASVDYVEDLRRMVCPDARLTSADLEQIKAGGGKGVPVGYAMFSAIAGKEELTAQEPETTPVIFDSMLYKPNPVGDLSTLAYRHVGKTANILNGDGSVVAVTTPPALPDPMFGPARTPEPEEGEEGVPEGETAEEHAGHGG
jgi:hypothetical protein